MLLPHIPRLMATAGLLGAFAWSSPVALFNDTLESLSGRDRYWGQGHGVTERDSNFYLRILPLGASITFGQGSTDGNGYRKYVRDRLRFDGWAVNMVGTQQSGTMQDNVSQSHEMT
jgi:hypothetical protein